ncbi:VOC family protein [Pantoea sp. FN060301]|uniref:VOC family protein n=1 Tax=Pantoea sp. FN060301 TaxID=3420380 RepID=UPI003D17F159
MSFYHLRIARPVKDLERSCEMYCAGLELSKIGEFTDHAGFSGCMIGSQALSWHLEFTLCHQHPVPPSPSPEDLLVLYIPELQQWQEACDRMKEAGFIQVTAFNPYWDNKGATFEDVDGYRTVIQKMRWDPS